MSVFTMKELAKVVNQYKRTWGGGLPVEFEVIPGTGESAGIKYVDAGPGRDHIVIYHTIQKESDMSIYEIITDTIIKKLESGTVPWKKTWGLFDIPRNGVSLRAYSGINTLLLLSEGFTSPYWFTWNQIQEVGGRVKKGERHSKVVYSNTTTKTIENEHGDEEEQTMFYLRYYQVWNFEQITFPEGFAIAGAVVATPVQFNPVETCTQIVDGYKTKPAIQHGQFNPSYNKLHDRVSMPVPEQFHSGAEYYATLFHELVHSTGHQSRLNRHELKSFSKFGDDCYSREELTAEIGAAFLCAHAGIGQPVMENTAAYIEHWLKVLREDAKAIVIAAGKAQRAAEYILGVESVKVAQ